MIGPFETRVGSEHPLWAGGPATPGWPLGGIEGVCGALEFLAQGDEKEGARELVTPLGP